MGSDEVWDKAEAALEEALKALSIPYEVNPGDGAFYGPKLDIMFVDALNRPWQLGTMQADFNMPKNFELRYTGDDNSDHQPVMLHRAILGSLERFIGVYLEHTAGRLPTWLAPEQVVIMNLNDSQLDYCHALLKELKAQGIRAKVDARSESLKFKIREAQLNQIPYMLTIGDKEVTAESVSVRLRTGETKYGISKQEFIEGLLSEVRDRALISPWQ